LQNLKTLYVYRPLLNADEIIKWAKGEGFEKTLPPNELHVTIAFSKEKMDWSSFKPENNKLIVRKGKRSVALLGEKAAVVKFESNILQKRWKQFIDGGASWDWDKYQPHVSITYDGKDIDLSKIKPYNGELIFGPEQEFKEVDLDWDKKVKEK